MKRKKIISFFLVLVVIVILFLRLNSPFVHNGNKLYNQIYKSDQLIVQLVQKGNSENLIIVGSGYSLDTEDDERIIQHDPFMILPNLDILSEDTTIMSVFYPFEANGLEQSGKELSNFINLNCTNYDNIVLIGHSKCGVCFANMAKWLEQKTTIVTISSSFYGTPIADMQNFSTQFNAIEKVMLNIIFGNHAVDQDLIIGSHFMKNCDYSGLDKHNHINIISVCPEHPDNLLAKFLCYLNNKGNINGDGIVPKQSQKLSISNTIEIEIDSTHSDSFSKGLKIVKSYLPDL